MTHLYTGGASSSQGSILVESIKRSDIIKDTRCSAAQTNFVVVVMSTITVV
jgi:hypothetical protein